MYITKALENHLKADPALAAIHKGQVWAGQLAPKGTKAPYQTFFIISDPAENRRMGIPCPRLQLNNFASTYAQAKQMAELSIKVLDGFGGVMGGAGGVTVENGVYDDQTDLYEPDTGLHNCPVDFKISYRMS